ncbi:MAG: divalent metal cation transporter, partial [Firmicutes bacterium]|nr:divalent metal cation transporter [Bacillota bacterium]
MEQKKSFMEKLKAAGPAAVITSAFIGPGTITTSTNAGVNFGYALLWAVVFSGISLIIIMNMASRLAIIGRKNIIDASVELAPNSNVWRGFILGLLALVIGLTALGFEAGNLIGATSGFADIFGLPTWLAALLMGLISLWAILKSTPKFIEMLMKFFVAAMGIVFVITSIVVGPNL